MWCRCSGCWADAPQRCELARDILKSSLTRPRRWALLSKVKVWKPEGFGPCPLCSGSGSTAFRKEFFLGQRQDFAKIDSHASPNLSPHQRRGRQLRDVSSRDRVPCGAITGPSGCGISWVIGPWPSRLGIVIHRIHLAPLCGLQSHLQLVRGQQGAITGHDRGNKHRQLVSGIVARILLELRGQCCKCEQSLLFTVT